ncbi:uncharacterized protein DUF59 [Hydrogenivirga caldilitoris]|uniref:Uncharacterized protein DUF59 n=1 Tax=Hydrogenivirga caldilitoris TaxID=246264 RepID=A0A497XU03_9AQUI|nr:iron-sulfur cluster assembly protein [Hydrogenivirga caldilitoris]RLJ70403.1 uncharacterized protein DUF59 [Hydrogenivirga caldilitoris]
MEEVREALREVIDPHTGMNLVDMGVVQHIQTEGEWVYVSLRPTSPFCPITDYLVNAVREKLRGLGFKSIEVELEDALY